MTVATVGLDGFLSLELLLKKLTEEGFIFILIIIQKGKAIANNPKYVFLFLAFYGTTGYNKGIAQKQLKSVQIIILTQDQREVNWVP
jgi:hypothetical protein